MLQAQTGGRRVAGAPAAEAAALTHAIEMAKTELAALIAGAAVEAGEILAFQVAMLEDEELAAPARAEIAAGAAADHSWHKALDAQITDYAA
jgi:phosphotransferase system enzyme I (PtsI)